MAKLDPIGKSSLGIDENIAAFLCYLFPFIGGIIFYLTEKDSKYVKFNAMQSMIIAVAWFAVGILNIILGFIPIIGTIFGILYMIGGLGMFVLAIYMIVKSFQAEWVELPIVAPYAKQLAKIQ